MLETITEEIEITETDVIPYEKLDDPDHRTHIVNPPANLHIWVEGMTAQEIVDIARMTGQKVVCLCGYTFVPTHDPDKYDACQPCIHAAGEIYRLL